VKQFQNKVTASIDFGPEDLYSQADQDNSKFIGTCGNSATFYAQVPCKIPADMQVIEKLMG